MTRSATRVFTGMIALAIVAAAAERSVAQEPVQSTAAPAAMQESPPPESGVELTDAPGREKAAQCGACHSLDYIRMNSHFLDLAGWTAVVTKMIKAYGAPIPAEDAEAIARYLAANYGKTTASP
jgi:sulfite dehydrogenase (cytochrome) subunit B